MRWQVHEAIVAARALAPFGLVWLGGDTGAPPDCDGSAEAML